MKYYIIAGEASGDLHGANLMKALKRHDPQADFRFWGGDRMAAEGGVPVKHIRDLAFMGFAEVVTHARTILRNLDLCKRDILSYAPDAVVMIDYPGFNLKIADFAHQRGLKTFFYISPQVWAWKQRRLQSMRRDLDHLYYILPFEQPFYAEHDFPQAHYVGHPLLDEVDRYRVEQPSTTPASDEKQIALLPGSRKQEISRTLPAMIYVARQYPRYRFVVAGMSLLGEDYYRNQLKQATRHCPDNVSLVMDDTYGVLSNSYAAIVCSGTATLETALFNVPQVVCYKGNALSAAIARRVLKVKYVSLVNLILDRPAVCELLQQDFTNTSLNYEFALLTSNDDYRRRMLASYDELRTALGDTGASDRTAQHIVRCLKSAEQ